MPMGIPTFGTASWRGSTLLLGFHTWWRWATMRCVIHSQRIGGAPQQRRVDAAYQEAAAATIQLRVVLCLVQATWAANCWFLDYSRFQCVEQLMQSTHNFINELSIFLKVRAPSCLFCCCSTATRPREAAAQP